MAVEFKDYYKTLGLERTASQEDIKKAFRKLARTCHPDLAADAEKGRAETRFKEINEAYEVLKDPEKRAKYDQLGADWERYATEGQNGHRRASHSRQYEYHFGGTGFSDFFEQFFGGFGADPFAEYSGRGRRSGDRFGFQKQRGRDVEADILVTLEEAQKGVKRHLSLKKVDPETGEEKTETIRVAIPAGVIDGQRIRLAGKGERSPTGGEAGDLYLKARFAQHPYFRVNGSDLHYELRLAPWEAVLGATVTVPTLHGSAKVRVKPGAQSGQQLRLREHGLATRDGRHGDLLAEISIRVPSELTAEQKALWERLRNTSNFNPRDA